MIPKNQRFYIDEYFEHGELLNASHVDFEMPSFCSGDYRAKIYEDGEGDFYIDREESYFEGCRDYSLVKIF